MVYQKGMVRYRPPITFMINNMQGDKVDEEKPTRLSYFQLQLVKDGRPSLLTAKVYVYEDLANKGAPLYRNDSKWRPLIFKRIRV